VALRLLRIWGGHRKDDGSLGAAVVAKKQA